MKTKVGLFTLVLGVGLLLQSGCAALLIGGGAAAGAGGYAYAKGELKSTESAPLDREWMATQNAMKELGYTVTRQTKDGLNGRLVARTGNNKKVNLSLKELAQNSTEIRIRVGVFGDQTLSRLILEKIRSEGPMSARR